MSPGAAASTRSQDPRAPGFECGDLVQMCFMVQKALAEMKAGFPSFWEKGCNWQLWCNGNCNYIRRLGGYTGGELRLYTLVHTIIKRTRSVAPWLFGLDYSAISGKSVCQSVFFLCLVLIRFISSSSDSSSSDSLPGSTCSEYFFLNWYAIFSFCDSALASASGEVGS